MADIFVSYTGSDRDWAFWVAKELEATGHRPHIHEWEIKGGDDIYAWMEQRHAAADHVLCVVSDDYLKAPYSTLERNAALWQAAVKRPGFVLFVAVKPCTLPTLADHIRRCELFGVPEEAARLRFHEFMERREAPATIAFPGKVFAVSNIPFRVPTHFLGRDDALAEIETAIKRYEGRVAITALHGLRGVGKTTLAAAYAERHRGDYRATWWISAQSESTMRADLIGLGIRLGWIAADAQEEPALEAVTERLRHEGEGILLIFDNAVDADTLKPYLPRGGAARVLVTSNAHAWRGMATPVEIRLWPKEIGADYLMVRTGRAGERAAADILSEALGGLPLAHEQAAAYCERLDISLADYRKRLEAAPARLLDDARHAPAEYHDGLTVAKTFALAIEEAAKLHPAAMPLIVHAALLAPEPIPLFLFSEAREKFGEPLATALVCDGLDEAVAALRAFALIERESIVDERDTSITTGTIRLHRLVREVAAALRAGEARDQLRRALVAVLAAVYPNDGYKNPASWPRCALLTPHLLASCEPDMADAAANAECADLLHRAGAYFHGRAAFSGARPLLERALEIRQKVFGPEDIHTAQSLNSLAILLQDQGDLARAQPLFARALAIKEKELGPRHPDTAASLNNLARLLQSQGDLTGARPLYERALAIKEKALGLEHLDTALSLNCLANLLTEQGDLAGARPLLERASAIYERALGPEHPHTAPSLSNLALLLQDQGDLAGARPLLDRVLAIKEKALGAEHPDTAMSLNNLASLLVNQGDIAGARPLLERAVAIYEKALGPVHPDTAASLNNLARLLQTQGDLAEARPLYERALEIKEKALGSGHPSTATSLNNLASLLVDQGDFAEARPLYERALVILEKVSGRDHPNANRTRHNLARLLMVVGNASEALFLGEAALSAHEKVLGRNHAWSKDSARVTAEALAKLGRAEEAAALRARYGIERGNRQGE
jgi:tetratricopeptide (TPR) repeat protein